MSDKQFTRREAIWIGTLGLLQLGILTSASVGSWDFKAKSDKPQINFSDLKEPPNNLEQVKNLEILRVAVASVISPMENVNLYEDLLNLLGERVQKQVQMVQRQNYTDTSRCMIRTELKYPRNVQILKKAAMKTLSLFPSPGRKQLIPLTTR